MKRIATALLISVMACGVAMAQDAATMGTTCATKAVGKDNKPLVGAAKASSVKKCCELGAVGADGKKLAGAAKSSYMKACQAAGK